MILDSIFPPDPRVENEALALIRQGHEIYVFCLTYDKHIKLREEYKGIKIIRVMVPKLYRSVSALAYTIPLYHLLLKKMLEKVFNASEFDAVHIHDMQSARTVFKMIGKKNVITVLDLHENRPEIMKYYEHVNSFLGKLLISPNKWKNFERGFIAKADKVIVVTESAKNYYCKIYNEPANKFVVVPNSVPKDFALDQDVDIEFVRKYEDKFVLLYLGNTGERRGIKEVIEAVNLLKDKIPDLLFLCVGSSKSNEHWKKMIADYGIENSVEFLGWQSFEKFPTFLSAGSVGLSPLHKNIHHDTTYANKLFQYMAYKLPLIVSNCDAQAKIVKECFCGLIFEERNANDLADKIEMIYNDQNKSKQMGLNGYQTMLEKYNLEITSEELIKLYDNYQYEF